ncbi:MAG: prolipoprotein diacylglyceryl transferase [Clostridia bacterium]|nr:prolipoprotein diacylglyceryl transferase [Clostridia bacterium]
MSAIVLLTICVTVLFILLFIRKNKYNVSLIKCIIITISSGALGLLGTRVLYFVENGNFFGQSFYGAVLFFPVFLFPVAWLLKIRLSDMLDYATPPGLAMLVLFKFNCYLGGCCGGTVLYYKDGGIPVTFPSQLVEMGAALALTILLFIVEYKNKLKRNIYSLCLITYGSTRFILNWFRAERSEYILGISAGHFWSIVSVFLGVLTMVLSYVREKRVNTK